MRQSASILFVLASLAATADVASAQNKTPDLRLATLEDLMKIEVTSASRREQPAKDVPAAVYVIGRDEIRRSGMTSIPELLRLAPGVQVARINSNKWAVSVRGFNSLYSNKLLVMVDGRSIYNPAYSTVLWDTEDVMIDDIDHIEVVRGPGGAMWGANAVNGVINIITRPSSETRGGLARLGGGTFDTTSAALRYGGALGAGSYRVFAQGSARGNALLAPGTTANDNWHTVTSGFRTDWTRGRDGLMFQGSVTSGRQRPLWFELDAAPTGDHAVSSTSVANVLGRWTRTGSNGASFQAQAYYDHGQREEAIGTYGRHTLDIDAQYHVRLGSRHDLVAGGGYRHIIEVVAGRGGYSFTPDRVRPLITNAFAQDTMSLAGSRLELTVGGKFENNTFAGSGFQPNLRVMWKASPGQRVWAGVARALRIPSLIDRGLRIEYAAPLAPDGSSLAAALGIPPGVSLIVGATGNPNFHSEHLMNTEAGYRLNVGSVASIDVVGFSGRYDDLQTYEPQAPVFELVGGMPQIKVLTRYENMFRATTRGAEVSGRVQLKDGWQIDSAFTAFHLTPHPNGSLDPSTVSYDGSTPARQWRAHVALPLGPRGQADLHLFRTGPLGQLDVPAFTRLDGRIEWSLTDRLSAVASGQNLLQASHPEFLGLETNMQATLVPRSATLHLLWRF